MALPKELGHCFHQTCGYRAYEQLGAANSFWTNYGVGSLLKSGIQFYKLCFAGETFAEAVLVGVEDMICF